MNLKNIIDAREAVARLAALRFTNYKTTRAVAKLRKAVENEYEVYAETERKCVLAYAEINDHGTPAFLPDGRLKLKGPEAKAAFEKEITSALETEISEVETISLHASDFPDGAEFPSPEDILILEPLVQFED